ncbi:MAG TPA: glycosyltransferase family 4 protein [Pyrinomonadaceae bacterium]|nr:glycosyltransferase family 4 protein [Pyrinomonadaceae bacterium]
MRILQVSSARTWGGGERHLADLTNTLANRGHDVYAALAPASPLFTELSALPSEKIESVPLRNALDLRAALKLARLVREHHVEIVHAHLARDYPLAALAVRKSRGARLILTRHLEYPLNRLHAMTLSKVSRVIAVSKAVERALRAQKIFAARKIRLISNGIDVERFESTGRSVDREAYRRTLPTRARLLVGITGELREHKGQEDLVRAAKLVTQEFEDVDFLIAGDDASPDKHYRAHLERLIKELGLESRVHLLGWLKDVAPFLHAIDLFVSSSRIEPFGLAIVEAMASGATVVATSTGGAQEIIENGVTGKLVPINDVEALSEALCALIKDEHERTRLSDRARIAARERFSLDRMVTSTEQLYREALNDILE